MGPVLCPPARAKDDPSARMSPLAHPREGLLFEKLVQVLVFGCAYERIADASCSESTLRREGVRSRSNSGLWSDSGRSAWRPAIASSALSSRRWPLTAA
jgi:hypothetical protein